MRVGVVGCGSIGRTVARSLVRFPEVKSVAFFDLDAERARALARLSSRYRAVASLAELVERSDLVVEAASAKAAAAVGPRALRAGKQVLFMSLGALADDKLWDALL